MYGSGIADAFVGMLLIVLLLGVVIGAGLFLGVPWLFHHLSFSWS